MIYMKINTKRKLIVTIAIGVLVCVAILVAFLVLYDNSNPDVIIINKGDYSNSEFWRVVYAGMTEAADKSDVTFSFVSARYEYEIEEQKALILDAIEKKPDVIVLVASDYYEIAPLAKKIFENGIQLIMLDSDVNVSYEYKESYIGTNSIKAGKYLGETASRNTPTDDRKAIILSHNKGVQTADDREAGIKQGYGASDILETYSCNVDEDIAYDIIKQLLLKDNEIVNIFCTNENVTIGAARAVQELELKDSINIYGFDGSKAHVRYLEMGILNYTIIQSPYQMGYLAVASALDLIDNKKLPEFIETDYLLINADNMYEPGFREILFPFIN